MSELKAYSQTLGGPRNVYLKSEADKVIEELIKEKQYIAEQMADIINGQEQALSHHKYKRCLAMAKWCFTKSNYHFVLARHGEDIIENFRRSILYSKWHKRWLELAEKFNRMPIPSAPKEEKDA